MKFSTGFIFALVIGICLFLFRLGFGQIYLPLIVLAAITPGLLTRKFGVLYAVCVAVSYILCEVLSMLLQTFVTDSRNILYPSYLHTIFVIALVSGYLGEKIVWLSVKTKKMLRI